MSDKWSRFDRTIAALKAKQTLEDDLSHQGRPLLVEKATLGKKFLVGGLDISFFPDSPDEALVAYTIMDFGGHQRPKLLYTDQKLCRLHVPYRAGYLGLRESVPMVEIVRLQQQKYPKLTPDVLLVDGNGILHKNQFGLACHVGVHLDLPTVGVAKKMYFSMAFSVSFQHISEVIEEKLSKLGDHFTLRSYEQRKDIAQILLTSEAFKGEPLFISQGHRIGLETAVKIVKLCVKRGRRVPEPVFQADLLGRQTVANLNMSAYARWRNFVRFNREMSPEEKNSLRASVARPTY